LLQRTNISHFQYSSTSPFRRGGGEVVAKRYEISNHLGNVLTIFTDKKTPLVFSGNDTIKAYKATLIASMDYYPFGMAMNSRNYNSSEYRFGFNGKEKDDEVKGTGNSLDFGARIYDPRIGRFLSIDPKWRDFTSLSSYLFADNNPIWNVDENGESPENGQFTGKARKTSLGVTVFRITTNDRKSINISKNILFACTGYIGAAANLADVTYNQSAFGTGTALVGGGATLAGGAAKAASPKGELGFKNVAKTLGNTMTAIDITKEITSDVTKEEFLEDATFKYASVVFAKTHINISNSSLLHLQNKNYDSKRVEQALNITYESLRDKHFKNFDLTTESGQEAAADYYNKNFKQINSDINKQIKDHFNEKDNKTKK